MSWRKLEKSVAALRQYKICSAVLVAVIVLLTSKLAYAEPSWCVKELKRGDDNVIVLHNPDCDLRSLARMYPQRDADGDILPMQVQLRSLYAANQTRVEDGVRRRYTVMRGCVRPGKPSEHADAEELQACPDGLMNYFSAPASDNAARIVVPVKRQLTIAERNLALAKTACEQLQSKDLLSDADQDAAKECKKEFPEMVFGAAERFRPDAQHEQETEPEILSALRNENQALKAKLAAVAPLSEKGKFIWPMFLLLVGLSIFGAGSTAAFLRVRRKKSELERNHELYVRGVNYSRKQWKKEVEKKYSGISEELAHKLNSLERQKQNIQQEARESAAAVAQARIDRLEAEKKRLAEEKDELQSRIDNLRTSIMPPPDQAAGKVVSAEAEQLRVIDSQAAEIRSLKEDLAGRDIQIQELRSEMSALTARNVVLESEAADEHTKAREANQKAARIEQEADELKEELGTKRNQVAQLENEVEGVRHTNAELRKQLLDLENDGNALQRRVEQLLGAAGMCGMNTGTGRCRDKMRQTLPMGHSPAESAQNAEDDTSPNVATRYGGMEVASEYSMVYPGDAHLEQYDTPESVKPTKGAEDAWNRGADELTPLSDEEEMEKRVSDSTRPQPGENPEEVEPFRLDRDPDEPRAEMPTLSEADGLLQEQIIAEQLIHYREAYMALAGLFAHKLVPGLKVIETSDTEDVYEQLKRGWEDQLGESARMAKVAQDWKMESDRQKQAREKNAKRIEALELDLKEKDLELASMQEINNALAADNARLQDLVKADKPLAKLYAYQLSAVEAESRALKAEKTVLELRQALKATDDELAIKNGRIADMNNRLLQAEKDFWPKERDTDSGVAPDPNKAEQAARALGLDVKDKDCAKDVLEQLPQEQVLKLMVAIMANIAERMRRGEHPEVPVGAMSELHDLYRVVNIPLVADYGFCMPAAICNLAGQGQLKLYHAVHDAFAKPEISSQEPLSKVTITPPAVVPDGNSASPPSDGSVVRRREAICPPSVSEGEDESQSAS